MAWPVAAAMAGTAALGYIGQAEANRANVANAKYATDANMADSARNREFQGQQASAQMVFQERMSNTAHQREVFDLKAAGLNPILSAQSGSGASSPQGAAGSGSTGSAVTATQQNPMAHFSGALGSALEAMSVTKQWDKTDAEIQNIKANTKKTGVDTEVNKRNIPEADLKNGIYEWAKSLFASDAKKVKNLNKDKVKTYLKKGATPNAWRDLKMGNQP